MAIELFRIDDRLIHGQVVVGWGQPMNLGFIVLVDDEVAVSDWEQELYRMGVPPEMEVYFRSVAEAVHDFAQFQRDARPGLLLTGAVRTMNELTRALPTIRTVNLGGVHHASGRVQRLRYVFLNPDEEASLRELAARGVIVTAQDVPGARPIPLDDVLSGRADG